ncbi:hypothetical protein [Streptomyces hygroscopicus]|uniref:hypothetical protein n=1 Tax=Streptomyces hygroscopicus TaxID=1912 RepID=UPI001FCB1BAD|nr:hypothetical protein [Streptomyces hygroscopicus]BDH13418.1 hypothetical protein HOK021_45970 [Streptomyces hygroscopicus]
MSALREAVLDLLARMRLMARTGQLRAEGYGLPEGYAKEAPEGRTVTDIREHGPAVTAGCCRLRRDATPPK